MLRGGFSILREASVLISKSRTQSYCAVISSCYSKPSASNRASLILKRLSSSSLSSVIMSSTSAAAGLSTASFDETRFKLSPSSVLKIEKGDLTQWFVDGSTDAIVNPANELMLGGGGADGAIHRAAGPELKEACYKVPEVRPGVRCPTGEARITPGFKLPVSHVIHTVGPIYDVDPDPKASLTSTYRSSLAVAKDNKIQFIAFPAISCGVYGYPYEEAASIAISTIKEFANGIKERSVFSDQNYRLLYLCSVRSCWPIPFDDCFEALQYYVL